MKTVKLTEKQLEVLSRIQVQKNYLKEEFAKVTSKEQDVLSIILDSVGIQLGQGANVGIENGQLLIQGPFMQKEDIIEVEAKEELDPEIKKEE